MQPKTKIWQPVVIDKAPIDLHKFEVHVTGVGCTVITKHWLLSDAEHEAAFQQRYGKRAEVVTC